MRKAITTLNILLRDTGFETLSCCCGHGKYPMTIVMGHKKIKDLFPFDLFTGKAIPRKRRFYKRDSEGYYYIPETLEGV